MSALIPGKALVPYPPELNAVEGAVARANGLSPDELYRGALCMGDKFSQSLAWDRIMQDRMRELSKEKARLRDMLDAADARRSNMLAVGTFAPYIEARLAWRRRAGPSG